MVDIRPNQLPDAILPLRETDELVVDQGADGVRKAPPSEAVNSVAPVASQAEAAAGADNTKRMTALRTKQSIASEVGVTLASNTQGAKADSAIQSVNGKTGNSVTLVKGDVGLGNVDNTSDANKPISTATQNALDTKANSSLTISAGSGLTGGGNLTANRTVSLNAASIASLAKADSSVQTVNGVAPTAGNVSVSAEEVRLQDSRSSAILESFAGSVNFLQTAGYYAPGDGGGALYKRVATEPTHTGKFQSADGTWWELAEEFPNILMFGGSESSSDNSAAFKSCLEFSGHVRIPDGRFLFNSRVVMDVPKIRVVGEGMGRSVLVFSGADQGFLFGGVTPVKTVEFLDISVRTTAVGTSTAGIHVICEPDYRPGNLFRRVQVCGDDGSGGPSYIKYFYRGIQLMNAMQPIFEDCLFTGRTATSAVEAEMADAAIYLEATTAAVIPRITGCHTLTYGSLVKIRSTAQPSIEGVYISNCDAIFCSTGIDIAYDASPYKPPQINIRDMNTECFTRGIYVKGASYVSIDNILSYLADFPGAGADHFFVESCNYVDIRGNSLESRPSNTTSGGVVLFSCTNGKVHDNTIYTPQPAVVFSGTTNNCSEYQNLITGAGARFQDVSSGASTNKGGASLGSDGYHWSSEGVLEQWGVGSGNVNSSGELPVTFTRPFPNSLWTIIVTNSNAAAGNEAPVVLNKSTTGFTVRFPGLTSGLREYSYEAKGI